MSATNISSVSVLGKTAAVRGEFEEQLNRALVKQQFELHYQPQIRLSDGCVIGAEALLRWAHPTRGLLPPAEFISVLEASTSATEVGRWVLRSACEFAGELAAEGMSTRIAVNLFASQLLDSSFYDDVINALAMAQLSPDLLELEITETTVLGLSNAAIDPLRSLRDLGIGIAFDDYGTGFASLSLLKRYPLTKLKIDKDFTFGLQDNCADAAIVKAVILLGEGLGLDVNAEGVETYEQSKILKDLGCAEGQGFFFGRPVAKDHFGRFIRSGGFRARTVGYDRSPEDAKTGEAVRSEPH